MVTDWSRIRIEASLDHPSPLPGADRTATIADRLSRHRAAVNPLERPAAIVATARTLPDEPNRGTDGPDRWHHAVDHAAEAHRVIERQHSRALDHDLGFSR